MRNKNYSWQDTIKDMKKCIYSDYTVNPKYRKEQTRFERRLFPAVFFAIFVPCLIFPFMIAFQWHVIVKCVIMISWVVGVFCKDLNVQSEEEFMFLTYSGLNLVTAQKER
jgi:hypothetical protein